MFDCPKCKQPDCWFGDDCDIAAEVYRRGLAAGVALAKRTATIGDWDLGWNRPVDDLIDWTETDAALAALEDGQ